MGNITDFDYQKICCVNINKKENKILFIHSNSVNNPQNFSIIPNNQFFITSSRMNINQRNTNKINLNSQVIGTKKLLSKFAKQSNSSLNNYNENNIENNIYQFNTINDNHEKDTYLGGEYVLSEDLINENIMKIQQHFKTNLLESLKLNEKNEKKFIHKTEYSIVKTKSMTNIFIKNITKENIKDNELIVNSEIPEVGKTKTFIYNRKMKNSFTSLKNSGIFSFEPESIANTPKGYFQVKKKKFTYYGNTNVEGKKNGFGIINWEDGSKLKGYFINSKINGYAIFTDSKYQESIFCGEYYDNIVKGYGYYIKDSLKTEGDCWFKNDINGLGIQFNFINGNLYKGTFLYSKKCGLGLFTWKDGTFYLGEFYEDKINGYGIIRYNNDSVYYGEFKDNKLCGFGEFLWNDYKYYCGEYKDGLKDGFGIFVWNFKKLDAYVGFWELGRINGVGIKIDDISLKMYVWKDGRKLNSIQSWKLSEILKPWQMKYKKFLEKDFKFLSKFIVKLQKGDIFEKDLDKFF